MQGFMIEFPHRRTQQRESLFAVAGALEETNGQSGARARQQQGLGSAFCLREHRAEQLDGRRSAPILQQGQATLEHRFAGIATGIEPLGDDGAVALPEFQRAYRKAGLAITG
jgi:hypothetical protein